VWTISKGGNSRLTACEMSSCEEQRVIRSGTIKKEDIIMELKMESVTDYIK
jgi:hypothetical protein